MNIIKSLKELSFLILSFSFMLFLTAFFATPTQAASQLNGANSIKGINLAAVYVSGREYNRRGWRGDGYRRGWNGGWNRGWNNNWRRWEYRPPRAFAPAIIINRSNCTLITNDRGRLVRYCR